MASQAFWDVIATEVVNPICRNLIVFVVAKCRPTMHEQAPEIVAGG